MPVNPFDAKRERQQRLEWFAREVSRVESQRTLWTMVYDNSAKDALKIAMLDRAWALLDCGECEAADALLEFVPTKDADKLLEEYFGDQLVATSNADRAALA